MPRKGRGEYPQDWKEIAHRLKEEAGWKCERCGAPHDPKVGRCLTVHHLDGDKGNQRWWNLAVLDQKCHLHIQHKVVLEQQWPLSHTAWFRPHVAGYYAHIHGLDDSHETVMQEMDSLIRLGQGA